MKIELVQNEDLTVKTKTGSTVTVPSPAADDTLATMADATLTEASGFTDWDIVLSGDFLPTDVVTVAWKEFPRVPGTVWTWAWNLNGGSFHQTQYEDENATSIVISGILVHTDAGTITATRKSIAAYQLGSQKDKHLQPAGNYALKSELPDVPVKTVKRNGTALVPDAQGAVDVDVPTTAGDVGAANQTALAAAFTAKAYAVGDLATYNGLLYRCKSAYTATAQSYKPNADTTHWEAAVVAVLLDTKVNTHDGTVDGLTIIGSGSKDRFLILGSGDYFVGMDDDGVYGPDSDGGRICWVFGQGDTAFATRADIAPKYDEESAHSYVVGQLVSYGDGGWDTRVYRCIAAHTSNVWVSANWTVATVEDVFAILRTAITGKLDANKRNLLDYTSGTTLAPQTAVYRFSADMNGTSASIPSLTYTGIPTGFSYYCFELEVYVPDTATSLTGPTTSSDPPWIWIPGGELPTYGYAGKTVFIACRMDCASRKVMANCYLVGDSIKVDPVGMETLALAAGVTPTDSTTVNSIQTKLGLSDTSTIQDAVTAVS